MADAISQMKLRRWSAPSFDQKEVERRHSPNYRG
jgi:hypothetical protein